MPSSGLCTDERGARLLTTIAENQNSDRERLPMKITFLGAAHEVTGSCTLLEACGRKILIDCGMEQGPDIYENCELPVHPAHIDFVLLTHAHIDHSGKLPLLIKNGFYGTVFATTATRNLCAIMLADAAHIQEAEAAWKNRKAKRSGEEGYTPMYTLEDVQELMPCFRTVDYGEPVEPCNGIRVEFFDAGHLLGSASIKLTITENGVPHRIVFSGDVGTPERPLLCAPVSPTEADTLIVESTYGDREREPQAKDLDQRLAEIIDSTLAGGGNVVIPSFAVGRTQELLYMLRRIKDRKLAMIDFPVWLDSPLAIEATNIYQETLRSYFDSETNALLDHGINPIGFDGLHLSVTSDASRQINADITPKVIISASGMCEAGRIRHHLKHNLWRPECTILFVGYQVEGTLGRKLLDGAKFVSLFGEEVKVCASIQTLDGISAHADRDQLIDWIAAMEVRPKRVFVNHGSDGVCDSFAKVITKRLGIEATAPYSGDAYDPVSGAQLEAGSRMKVRGRSTEQTRRFSAVWSRLYAAGIRLMGVIERSRDCKSKNLVVLTNRINALCDKQEKEIRK